MKYSKFRNADNSMHSEYMKLVKTLARNVQQLMIQKGYSQSELARVSGVPQPTISRCITGVGAPSAFALVALASALGNDKRSYKVEDLLSEIEFSKNCL